MIDTPAPTRASAVSGYGFHCALPEQDFTQAVAKVTEALKVEGFGILTEIDVQATMKDRHIALLASRSIAPSQRARSRRSSTTSARHCWIGIQARA